MSTRLERRVVAKTADYTINPTLDRPGTTFTNRAASGEVIFTLPAPNLALTGWWYRFKNHAAQSLKVKTATVDTLVTLSDATADSIACSDIGGDMEAFCDGTSWFANGQTVGATFTVAT